MAYIFLHCVLHKHDSALGRHHFTLHLHIGHVSQFNNNLGSKVNTQH